MAATSPFVPGKGKQIVFDFEPFGLRLRRTHVEKLYAQISFSGVRTCIKASGPNRLQLR
jgi:hypothetical protein